MAGSDLLYGALADQFLEKAVAGVAGGLFQITGTFQFERTDMEREAKPLCNIVHKPGILLGIGPA
jgi:hypothetical protein